MKKILFLALALCGSVTFSQESRFSFGVKAGSNISNINDTSQTKYKVGFVGGVFANYKILPSLSLQPEVLYSMQGYKSKITGDYGGAPVVYTDNVKMNYISIPIMVQYTYRGFYAEAGPQFAFNVKNSLDYEVSLSYYGNNVTHSDKLKDIAKDFDFAIGVGLGYHIPDTKFSIGARYTFSLTPFYTNKGTTSGGYNFTDYESGKPKNRVYSLLISYKI